MKTRIFQKKDKETSGWGYWGEVGDIDVGISYGKISGGENSFSEPFHFHKRGTVYILGLEGEGSIEVDNTTYTLKKDEVLRINPGEKYRHVSLKRNTFSWITFCTIKSPQDKVVVE